MRVTPRELASWSEAVMEWENVRYPCAIFGENEE